VSVLDRKVLRDVWNLRGQVITIALLVATGVAVLVGSVSTYASLLATQDTYYRASHFANVWADVKRAPTSVFDALSETLEATIV
jgi:putative ABC transport system permease protein